MLEVKNLVKSYGSLKILNGINFKIEKGNIYGFLGMNGAGKSTTMNIISGLIGYDAGEIYLDGHAFKRNNKKLLTKIGYLPQSPQFYGYMTPVEYLNFIGQISNMDTKDIKRRSFEILEIVDLKEASKRKTGGFSGGMKQRFGLAVAMFNSPEILILDEPTSALDPQGRMDMLNLISTLKENGTTVFLSSHILNDIERVCDKVSILSNGEIILTDELSNLRDNYIKPIYDIEFENDCTTISNALRKYEYIDDIKQDKNKISIHVNNIENAKHELLSKVSAFNNPVLSFNLRRSTLEDIFIGLVNKSERI